MRKAKAFILLILILFISPFQLTSPYSARASAVKRPPAPKSGDRATVHAGHSPPDHKPSAQKERASAAPKSPEAQRKPAVKTPSLITDKKASTATVPVSSTPPSPDKKPTVTPKPAKPKEVKPVEPVKPLSVRTKSRESAEEEVINNILGRPDEPAPPKTPVAAPPSPGTPQAPDANTGAPGSGGEVKQRHFSFLDPEAAEVLAPEFDYGVYSMNLRILDNYRKRIEDALETARQLSLPMPEDKVKALLADAYRHRRKFDTLYLGGQTTQGLQEFDQARRLAIQALALTAISPKVEGRAIWLDRSTIVDSGSPEELRKRLGKLRQAGINIVYFETVNAGFPVYPSALMRQNPLIQGWDPLKVAVEEGHRLGMEVHAWVWVFAVGNRRHNALIGQPPDYPGPVLTEQSLLSEALRNRAGGLSVDERQHEYWLSPASPRAREFLLNVYREIVGRYDVDGLHLDYIRYPFQTGATRMGYEPVGREHFYRVTGLSLDDPDSVVNRMWIAWKTYQVSSFVEQVSTEMRKMKPGLKISAAVFPIRRESRIMAIQQDWETWIDHGWVDTLSPMSYTSDPERLQEMFEYVQASPHRHPLIYPGIALRRLDGGQLMVHLDALRQKGSLGSTLFAGAHLDAEKAETLGSGPFKDPGSLPPHQDIGKSLRTILGDYRQKFSGLMEKNMLGELPAEQAGGIRDGLNRLDGALNNLGPSHQIADIAPDKLQQVYLEFQTLQTLTQTWYQIDQPLHPFRAQYFARNMQLMDELLGYLIDRVHITTVGSPGPTPFIPPPDLTPTGVMSTTLPSVTPAGASKPAASSSVAHPNTNETPHPRI